MTPQTRYRGFNLPDMFLAPGDARFPDMIRNPRGRFSEFDFRLISSFGFNFVRLPLCYLWWSDLDRPLDIRPNALSPIDRALEYAQKYDLHLCLCLHHAPGYCINPPLTPDPFDLFKDPAALHAFVHHWHTLANRYHHAAAHRLSFNLLNEPAQVSHDDHHRVMTHTITAIRQTSPHRPIIVDGIDAGNTPCPELLPYNVIHGCRGYMPSPLTHHLAPWAGSSTILPAWPQPMPDGTTFGPTQLSSAFQPWLDLQSRGASVFCGELGTWNRTPHTIALAWMKDLLTILTQNHIGYALWNFRGSFGILDSHRPDVQYKSLDGELLDEKMLVLLQQH